MTVPTWAADLAHVEIDVDDDGHLAVTLNDEAWQPPADPATGQAGIALGRGDIPWLLDHLLNEEVNEPMYVMLHDGGQTYTDFVVPERLKAGDPSYSTARPGYAPDRHRSPLSEYTTTPEHDMRRPGPGIDGGGFDANEPVFVALVVARTTADANGEVMFRVPTGLHDRVDDLLVYGQDSGLTLHFGSELDKPQHDLSAPLVTPARDVRQHADFGHDFGPGAT
jgi:hypothetical protein